MRKFLANLTNLSACKFEKTKPSSVSTTHGIWSLLLMLLALLSGGEETARAFDAFEHKYIGDKAYENITKDSAWTGILKEDWKSALNELGLELGRPNVKANTVFSVYLMRQPLRFGDLPALAGDHAETVADLHEILNLLSELKAKNSKSSDSSDEAQRFIAIRRQWENMCIWLSSKKTFPSLADCPELELESQEKPIRQMLSEGHLPLNPLAGSVGYQPSRAELAEFERLKNYVDLLTDNINHFPRYSWRFYSIHHREALKHAVEYAARSKANDRSRAHHALKMALLYEGFAQHFLHDSFSSGHLGTHYSGTHKEVLQHFHDTLNRIGTKITMRKAPEYLWDGQDPVDRAMRQKIEQGWTAFGDQHLFIPEAAFHRLVVVKVATKSLEEVFIASRNGTESGTCRLCTEGTFPVELESITTDSPKPVTDYDPGAKEYEAYDLAPWGSRDVRVPQIFDEGWKMLVTVGPLFGRFTDGGSVWDFSRQNDRKVPTTTATTFELGYVRTTEKGKPNFFGAGAVIAPGVRTSIYPLSVGYWEGDIEKESGLFGGIRLNAGLRIDEANSTVNPGPKDLLGGEVTVVTDLGYRIRSPLTLFTRLELGTMNLRGRFPSDLSLSADSIFHKGGFAMTFGVIYDIAEVFK